MRAHGAIRDAILDLLPNKSATHWRPEAEIGVLIRKQGIRHYRASLVWAVQKGHILRKKHDITGAWLYAKAKTR